MNGVIDRYFRGCGWIIGEDGNSYFLHYSDMQMPEKYYKKGRKVTFDPADQGREHLNAVNVYVEKPEPVEKRPSYLDYTGFGEWVNTPEKGRYRCTDCQCTTDQGKSPYCPHCGAVMNKELTSNEAEIARRRERAPLWKWRKLEYGYRCSHCKLISAYPNMFCRHCGKYMEKFSEAL